MQEEIKIEDLIPRESSFKLEKFKDFIFKLEPCTAGKLIEITKEFGNSVEIVLADPSAENVSKLAIMLMDYESASRFKKQKVKIIDLSGEEKEVEVGGYMLLAGCIQGISEQYGIYRAVLLSFGYKKEKVDRIIQKLIKAFNDSINDRIVKKKVTKKKKKKTKKR